jgi:Ca2+-binding RTX toxin-like protein
MAANVENMSLTTSLPLWAVGNGLANTIRGNGADNAISGGAGDDWLYGGDGNDRITGSAGADHLVGDAGRDMFVFTEAAGLDFVHGFQRGLDRLNLAAIDADAGTAGDQAFSFVGDAVFSGTMAGELSYDGLTLSGDIDGDGQGDFAIRLANHPALAGSDLVL